MKKTLIATLFLAVVASAFPAFAQAVDWQYGFQDAASASAVRIHEFHHMMIWIISSITLFVFILLAWVILRYNRRANPIPAQFSHNVLIEVIWTVIPVVILILIVIPSFKLLYYTDRTENAEMTLKITGYQWYWGYEYPDNGNINFMSYLVPEKELKAGQKRLLSTDAPVVLPVDTNIRLLVTASDVLHSWAVPAFAVKMDAEPGHLNETWVRINKPGIYYGECSELCGKDHAFMPIEVHAVPKAEFAAWVAEKGGTMPVAGKPNAVPAAQNNNAPAANAKDGATATTPSQPALTPLQAPSAKKTPSNDNAAIKPADATKGDVKKINRTK